MLWSPHGSAGTWQMYKPSPSHTSTWCFQESGLGHGELLNRCGSTPTWQQQDTTCLRTDEPRQTTDGPGAWQVCEQVCQSRHTAALQHGRYATGIPQPHMVVVPYSRGAKRLARTWPSQGWDVKCLGMGKCRPPPGLMRHGRHTSGYGVMALGLSGHSNKPAPMAGM